jgi:acetyl/propionyl-CoA carboxylase alpha subunit
VKTNLGLLQAVVAHPAFVSGALDLGLLESMPASAFAARLPADVLLAAAASDVGPFEKARGGGPWSMLGAWRASGRVRLEYAYHGRTFVVDAERVAGWRDAWRITVEGRAHEIEAAGGAVGDVLVWEGGSETAWRVRRQARRLILETDGRRYVLARPAPSTTGLSRAAAGTGEMRAPMPAVVVRVLVSAGDHVTAHQPLVVLEAMKIEHIIGSSLDGVVRQVRCTVGQRVAEGEILVEVTSGAEPGDATS